jgi:hypothetical protein
MNGKIFGEGDDGVVVDPMLGLYFVRRLGRLHGTRDRVLMEDDVFYLYVGRVYIRDPPGIPLGRRPRPPMRLMFFKCIHPLP